MILERFKKKDNRQKAIFVGVVILSFSLLGILVYRSYAIYQESHNFNVIHGNVPSYMSDYDVKLSLTIDGNTETEFPSRDSEKVFESAECDKGAKGVWDYERWAPVILNTTKTRTKCQFHFVSKYSESILNGTDPVLHSELIPVTIDESGVVRKASLKSEWYKYSDKKWANAVILEDESVVYQDNEEIPEDNIESYFVWIPRYRFKIFNDGTYTSLTNIENKIQAIEIVFENKNIVPSTGSSRGKWLTHPAFTSFDVNGMWVGKFETGYKGATTMKEAQIDVTDSGSVVIKPNVYSWRGIRVANAFTVSYSYQRSMDSHMMKNTEWGAVAYLSHSVYGTQTSVRINNNSSFITGYAAKSEPSCGNNGSNDECNIRESIQPGIDGTYTINYENKASDVASTTGNRSGIYDMSGGSFEYVMGVMSDKNGLPVSGRNNDFNSNFVGTLTMPQSGSVNTKTTWTESDGGVLFPDKKYYDLYTYGEDDEHYNRRLLGDATGEMGPFADVKYGAYHRQVGSWYGDEAWFVRFEYPWVKRGSYCNHGEEAGVFAFNHELGCTGNNLSFRIVLSF